jgi:LacI family transcriptional regulator
VRALCDHQSAALILTSQMVTDGALIADVVRAGVPVVQAIRRVPGLAADFVGIDDRAGAREAARHVVEAGHREIAILAGPGGSSASAERTYGFLEVLAEEGIEPRPDRMAECRLTGTVG